MSLLHKQFKTEDVQMKMRLAKHVTKVCEDLLTTHKSLLPDPKLFTDYMIDHISSFSPKEFLRVKQTLKKAKSMEEWLEERKQYECSILYEEIRRVLVDLCLNKRLLPQQISITTKLYNNNLNKATGDSVLWKGFSCEWSKKKNTHIVMEDPNRLYKRILYLENIMRYRNDDRHIVYIDEMMFDNNLYLDQYDNQCTVKNIYLIAASSQLGIISSTFFSNTATFFFEKWILDSVLPFLPSASVLVFGTRSHHEKSLGKLPTVDSTKSEICNWLEANNVPHDNCMHRAELLKLIKKYNKFQTVYYRLDHMLKVAGHEVLRRPLGLTDLMYFRSLRKKIQVIITLQRKRSLIERIDYTAKAYRPQHWISFEKTLIQNEMKIYHEDRMMELVDFDVMKMEFYRTYNLAKQRNFYYDHLLTKCIYE